VWVCGRVGVPVLRPAHTQTHAHTPPEQTNRQTIVHSITQSVGLSVDPTHDRPDL